jgi:hypothetical protein
MRFIAAELGHAAGQRKKRALTGMARAQMAEGLLRGWLGRQKSDEDKQKFHGRN